jgi:aflatoxin B1 aldehyde reductase
MMSGEQNDGTIVGASRVAHVEQNLSACKGGPLPQEVVEAFDRAWETVRPHCPKYLRP